MRTAPSRSRRSPRNAAGPRARAAAHARCAGAARAAPRRSCVSAKASSASRFARSPIACTATGKPASAPRRTISASSSPLVICTPGAVEHPRRAGAERPVHEHLQVADPQVRAAEARAEPDRRPPRRGGRAGSTARRAASAMPLSSSCCHSRSAPSQPSLSCTAVTPRAFASRMPTRIAVEVLLVGERHVARP